MKIGIIGIGYIGGTLARLWANASHEVILSSRHKDKAEVLAQSIGANAKAASPEEAAQLADIVLISIPLGEIAKLSPKLIQLLKGKIVMDTCNPYPERDGAAGTEALNSPDGSGVWVAKHLPGAKIVKAFNTVYYKQLQSEAHQHLEDPLGIPLAADDKNALKIVSSLVKDAGFGPVIVGELQRAKDFDHGTRPYASNASVSQLRKMLSL